MWAYGYEEFAALLGCSVNAVRVAIHRGLDPANLEAVAIRWLTSRTPEQLAELLRVPEAADAQPVTPVTVAEEVTAQLSRAHQQLQWTLPKK